MKFALITDLHLDKSTFGVPRAPEIERGLRQVEIAVAVRKVDVVIFLGDLTDPDSGGLAWHATRTATELALNLDREGIESIWIAGNHDVQNDGTGATCLTPMVALSRVIPRIHVAEGPKLVVLGDGYVVACLPYTAVSRTYDPATTYPRLISLAPPGSKIIVAAHLMIPGVAPGEETIEMPRGRDIAFPLGVTADAVFRCNGHYHRRQDFDPNDGGPVIHIPGAPVPFAFGEEGNPSVFSVVTL